MIQDLAEGERFIPSLFSDEVLQIFEDICIKNDYWYKFPQINSWQPWPRVEKKRRRRKFDIFCGDHKAQNVFTFCVIKVRMIESRDHSRGSAFSGY